MKESSIKIYKDMPNGFHLHSAGLSQTDTGWLLRSSDEWEVLAGVLLSCQAGDFSSLSRIRQLLCVNDGFQFWKAACELLGYAGSRRLIEEMFEQFRDQFDDRGVQYFLAIPLANSCGLWAVEPLLTLHAQAAEEDSRYQIERHISYLLEEEDGSLWAGAAEKTEFMGPDTNDVRTVVQFESYAAEVRAIRDELIASTGSVDASVYEGRLLDIAASAKRLYARLASREASEGRIYREKMLFEASTGVDCRGFFDKDNSVQYLQGAALMESFLESEAVGRFKPGQRYFFGHVIPAD